MIWQDIVMTTTMILVAPAVWLMVFKKNKPPLFTALIAFATSYTNMVCLFTMNLKFAPAIIGINATTWFVVFIQVLRKRG